jgi:3-methyladenine DNA glycosylase/8-oxoguanine DNA glycosylase
MAKKLDHTEAVAYLSRVDRKLARIIAKSAPIMLQPEITQSIFDALLESIIYQQLNGKVAAIITARVKALFPDNASRIQTRHGKAAGFPTPQQVLAATPELLRSAGLSQAKMLAIRDLAAKTLDGTVPTTREAHRMSDDELVERLTAVRGIGRWTVEMLLVFRLGRPDVLAVDDYGIRKGFAKIHKLVELPKPKELLAYGERWRPYRSVASWYLWRAAEMKDLPMVGEQAAKKAAPNKAAGKKTGTKTQKKKSGGGRSQKPSR